MPNNPNEKHFKEWIELKEELHLTNSCPNINEGEIWWCSCGENVGIEINGKSQLFSRPVLIYKKLSRLGFIGIPLTSQNKIGSWYTSFEFKNRRQIAVLSQIRALSVARLSNRVGKIDKNDIAKIKNAVKNFFA